MPAISFKAKTVKIRGQSILKLPSDASKQLPSRGQVAVSGTINGRQFQTVLEPDGNYGHWIKIDKKLQAIAGIATGDNADIEIEPAKQWPEPQIPADFAQALASSPQKVKDKWKDITPMARWEWIRWINATANADTRAVRIEKSISKLNGAHRRPCCFNLAACTNPELSKSGRLVES